MEEAHRGRGIGDKDFQLVAGYAREAMRELGVPENLTQEVMDLLGTLRA